MILNKGKLIANRYEIQELIAQGGMSMVYRALDTMLNRSVTFKVLKEEFLTDNEVTTRFRREARSVARLSHPNIVNVFDVGAENDVNYIVMEYVDGMTLKDLIAKSAPFNDISVLSVTVQIAAALSHAHKNGIIHQDIKPQNIMVTRGGDVKVMDFGIALTVGTSGGGAAYGSVHYVSPEQARGAEVDFRTDLYSLGIVMYEMATGALPYSGTNPIAVARKHIMEPLPDITALNPNIATTTLEIIAKLTQKDPNNRFPSAEALAVEIKRALARLTGKSGYEELDYHSSVYDTMKLSTGDIEDEEYDEEDEDFADEEIDYGAGRTPERTAVFAAIATALVIIIIASFLLIPRLFGKPEAKDLVEVPNIKETTTEKATTRLENLGLKLDIIGEQYSETVDEGYIIAQNYEPGGMIPLGESVGVLVSLGTRQFQMIDLTGKTSADAKKKIADENLPFEVIEDYEYSSTVPIEVIIRQEPAVGEWLKPGEKVYIFISKGPELTTTRVPNVLGLSESAAKEKLLAAGLKIGAVNTDYSSKYEKGLVCFQASDPDKEVVTGTIVGITISIGPAPVTPTPSASDVPTDTETPNIDNPTDNPDDTTDNPDTNAPKRKTLTISPPLDEGIESVHIRLVRVDGSSYFDVYSFQVNAEDFPLNLDVFGFGKEEYILFVDGVSRGSQVVDFTE